MRYRVTTVSKMGCDLHSYDYFDKNKIMVELYDGRIIAYNDEYDRDDVMEEYAYIDINTLEELEDLRKGAVIE